MPSGRRKQNIEMVLTEKGIKLNALLNDCCPSRKHLCSISEIVFVSPRMVTQISCSWLGLGTTMISTGAPRREFPVDFCCSPPQISRGFLFPTGGFCRENQTEHQCEFRCEFPGGFLVNIWWIFWVVQTLYKHCILCIIFTTGKIHGKFPGNPRQNSH